MGERIGTLRQLLVDAKLSRVYLSFAAFSLAEFATWLATLVYAFERSGVGGAGRLAVVSLVAAMVVAPFAAWSGDRFRPDRALTAGYAIQAAIAVTTAVAMYADAVMVAYAAAAALVAAVTVSRPLVNSLLPLVVSRPADLVGSNVIVGSTGQIGRFLGPLLAAALLVAGTPALVFAVSGGLLAFAALAILRFDVDDAGRPRMDAAGVVSSVFAGLRSVWSARSLRSVVALMFSGALVGGIGDVAIVTFADERLSSGGSVAGVLSAAIGFGGLIGIVSVTSWASRKRLARPLAVAALAAGLPIAALPAISSPIAATVLLAGAGFGLGMIAVLGTVAIQRLADEDTLARVFGVQESLEMAALAVGAALASTAIDGLGLGEALLWLGIGTSALALLCTAGFVRSGADVAPPDPVVVDRILADALFAPLGVRAIERLAVGADRTERAAGSDIVTTGDIGYRYFLVVDGEAEVWMDGSLIRHLGPGDSFGEIALLEDRPRTATVRANTEVTALTIERDLFIAAVTGHPRSSSTAAGIIDGYVR